MLQEDFVEKAEKTLDAVGALAKKAHDKFRSAKNKAKDDIHRDVKAGLDAVEKDDKEAAEAKLPPASSLEDSLIDMLMDAEDPRPDAVKALVADHGAEDLQDMQAKMEKISKRLSLVPANLRSVCASFDPTLSKEDIDRGVGEQSEALTKSIEDVYFTKKAEEDSLNALWYEVLSSDDEKEKQASFLKWARYKSKANQKKNMSSMQNNTRPVGIGVITILALMGRVFQRKASVLKGLLKQAESQEQPQT